jgi:hypothetical protein
MPIVQLRSEHSDMMQFYTEYSNRMHLSTQHLLVQTLSTFSAANLPRIMVDTPQTFRTSRDIIERPFRSESGKSSGQSAQDGLRTDMHQNSVNHSLT